MNKGLGFKISHFESWSSLHDDKYVLNKLNKMQTRRMTKLAKTTVDLALKASDGNDLDFVVFSSRHGEVTLAYDLIQSLICGEIPSPTKFSQSTHNAVAGLFSIQSKCLAPMTAVSADRDSFLMGLINCASYLKLNPTSKVLYIFGEASLPKVYETQDEDISRDEISIAMILESGDEFSISASSKVDQESTANQPFSFLEMYRGDMHNLTLTNQDFTLSRME